jgi:iron complex outermembrane recepter protein
VAGFFNRYTDLQGVTLGTPAFDATANPPRLVVPLPLRNNYEARTWGVELGASWRPSDRWRLNAAYTWLHLDAEPLDGALPENEALLEDRDAAHQVHVRSSYAVTDALTLNATVFYVGTAGDVDEYVRLDSNVAWQPRPGLTLRAGVQNALDDRHPESVKSLTTPPAEIQMSAYAQLTAEF